MLKAIVRNRSHTSGVMRKRILYLESIVVSPLHSFLARQTTTGMRTTVTIESKLNMNVLDCMH